MGSIKNIKLLKKDNSDGMTEKRFNRTITGEIYDSQNDGFVDEDFVGKPLGYEDGIIILLNTLHEENEELKEEIARQKYTKHITKIIYKYLISFDFNKN